MPTESNSNTGNSTGARLRSIVQRIETLEEEKAALASDIREVYAEAKGDGFDVKALREVIRRRKQDRAELQELDALVELYTAALGDFVSTPLGEASMPGKAISRGALV